MNKNSRFRTVFLRANLACLVAIGIYVYQAYKLDLWPFYQVDSPVGPALYLSLSTYFFVALPLSYFIAFVVDAR